MGTAPPVQTVSHITVTIADITAGEMNTLLFSSCSPPDWSVEAPKHIFHGDKGKPNESIIASIQTPQYGTMTLTQGWDPSNVLGKWMTLIEQPGDISTKKKAVEVQFQDSQGNPILDWKADQALLTGFSHSPSDASSNGVLTITATIDADTWKLTKDGNTAF